MRPQTAGLVFCALVLSTCGHELSNHAKAAPHSRKAKQLTRSSAAASGASASSDNNLDNQDGRSDWLLLSNANTNLVGFLNATQPMGVIFDVNAGILAVYCGSNGNYYAIDLEAQVGAYVWGKLSEHSWIARYRPFPDFFNSRRCLKGALEFALRNGERFDRRNIGEEVATEVQLSIELVSRGHYSTTRSRAVHRAIHVTRTLVDTLRGPLRGLPNIWGTRVIPLGVSLRALVVRLKTLGEIVTITGGGADTLAKAGVNWRVIVYEQSSIRVFLHVFSRLIQSNIDVRPIIRTYSIDFNAFLGTLGGNSTRGITGITKVIGELRGLADGRTTINELVPILLEYFRNRVQCNPSFEEFKREHRDLLIFLKTHDLACEVPIEIDYIEGILQNRFEYKGVNVILILRFLFELRGAPVQNVVQILAAVRHIVKIERSVGLLIYFLLQQTVDGSVKDVLTLVPGVQIDRCLNILIPIFKGAKLSCEQDLYRFLLSRPLLGRVLSLIDRASDCVNLEELFRSQDFAPFASAITRLVARAIRRVNEDGPVTRFTYIPTYQPSCGGEGKGRHGAGTRHLNGHSKHLSGKHLSHAVKHLKSHGHVKHHHKEKHHVHEKHHGHDKHRIHDKHHGHDKHKHGRKNRELRHDRGKHHEKRSKHARRHQQ